MDADPIFLPPQDYSITWPVLGGLIIFALVIWVMLVWLLTRRPDPDAGSSPLPPEALAKLRQEALDRVGSVEEKVGAGTMTARRGHHELSKVVRDFVSRASGLEAETMTAADLRERGPAHLSRLIEEFYPRQFGSAEADRPSIGRSAEAARQVIGGWA